MTIIVFHGPTVDGATVREILPAAECRPPAAQGDLHAAAAERPLAIALIDGAFLDRPSVWHREILAALDSGAPVWGAASMGALRAAECADFGMIGVGKIFEAFRDGRYPPFTERFEDDDEVAVIHGPADLGSRPLSDALVDLRECLARAEAGGVIDRLARDCLLERLKALPFGQRNFQTLLRFATEGLGATASEAHSANLTRHRVSQKREDAIALLQALRDQPERRIRDGWTFERTLEWERFVAGTSAAPLTGAESRALAGLERDPAHARTLRRRGAARLAAIELASENGGSKAALSDFREDRDLLSRKQLDEWLANNLVAPDAFGSLISDEAALEALAARSDPVRLARAMLDEMRLEGSLPGHSEGGSAPS